MEKTARIKNHEQEMETFWEEDRTRNDKLDGEGVEIDSSEQDGGERRRGQRKADQKRTSRKEKLDGRKKTEGLNRIF